MVLCCPSSDLNADKPLPDCLNALFSIDKPPHDQVQGPRWQEVLVCGIILFLQPEHMHILKTNGSII